MPATCVPATSAPDRAQYTPALFLPTCERMNTPSFGRRLPRLQHWGVILWPSFIAAGLASIVFFACVDPLRLHAISFPGQPVSRGMGYTVGFFMFWAVTALSSAITGYLLRPPPPSAEDDELPLG